MITDIQKRLFSMQDEEYKPFIAKLVPTVHEDLFIGVKTPNLRGLARELFKNNEYDEFIGLLPHKYYEENNLHAFIIEQTKDFKLMIERTNAFLPYIDNWATCDSFSPKVFKTHTVELLPYINEWINSDKVYTIRYGIKTLMNLYLGDNFSTQYCDMVASVKSDEYYVNMMVAWYFATALAKQYDMVLPYITQNRLGKWTHNKAIQKAKESNRVTKEQKEFLNSLKK